MLNRLAVVVTAKQPVIEWLHFHEPEATDITLDVATHDPNVYLLPECDSENNYPHLLEESWETIFESELEQWYTDEAMWPHGRTIEMFRKWFDCKFHSMIVDLCGQPLE